MIGTVVEAYNRMRFCYSNPPCNTESAGTGGWTSETWAGSWFIESNFEVL